MMMEKGKGGLDTGHLHNDISLVKKHDRSSFHAEN